MSSKSIFSLAPRPSLSLEPTSSARKFHIRRLQDILQLSVQREDFARAKKAWAILARCNEVDWINIWETGLSVIGKATDQSFEEHGTSQVGSRERLDYLKIVMLRHKPGREQILQEIVLTLIASQRHQEALDELELYLPSFPFQDNPVLHTYAGLIALFLAPSTGSISGPRSQYQTRKDTLVREAKSHFERALALDQGNVVALRFLDKISQLSHSRWVPTPSQGNLFRGNGGEADESDDENDAPYGRDNGEQNAEQGDEDSFLHPPRKRVSRRVHS